LSFANHEREKKAKYLDACLAQRRYFFPFFVSTDGVLGEEVTTLIKSLSALLAETWSKPYSLVCAYINARMSIAVACATTTHICIRGSRIPASRISNKHPFWEDAAGIGLFKAS
jgi:hypothetical protein